MIITQLYPRKANIIFISNTIEYSEVKIAVIIQSIKSTKTFSLYRRIIQLFPAYKYKYTRIAESIGLAFHYVRLFLKY